MARRSVRGLFGCALIAGAASSVAVVPAAQAAHQEATGNAGFAAAGGRSVAPYDAAPEIAGYARLVFDAYAQAWRDAAAMREAIGALVRTPSRVTLAAARAAWRNARPAYLRTEAFRFYEGPIDRGPDADGVAGPEPRLNAWPLNEAVIDYVAGAPKAGLINDRSVPITRETILARDQTKDETEITTGWHAIEFILWGQDRDAAGPGNRPVSDFTTAANADRRKAYLVLVTDMLVDDLKGLTVAWAPGVADNYAASFVAADQKAGLGRILTGLATLAGFELANDRLATALDSGDQEDEHSCFSDTTDRDLVWDLRGIRDVYFGDVGAADYPGLNELIGRVSPALDRRLIALLDRAEAAVGAIDAPFDRVLAAPPGSRPRAEAEAAHQALLALARGLMDAARALGVNVAIPGASL